MITFTHDEKSISLGPKAFLANDPLPNNAEEGKIGGDSKTKSKLLNIHGILHLLFESPLIESVQSRNEDYVNDVDKNDRVVKRSPWAGNRLITIEICTMIDYSLYRKFYEESKAATDQGKDKDAIQTLLYIFTHIMQTVNIIVERIENNHCHFTTTWVGAYISKNASDIPFIENSKLDDHTISVDDIRSDFNEWSDKQKLHNEFKLPKYDFLALFTSYDMRYEKEDKYIIGITNPFSICGPHSQTIILHRRFFETATTIVHELGHTIGLLDSNDDYIMALVTKDYTNDDLHNSYFFSKMDVEMLEWLTERMDRTGRSCLTNEGNDFQFPERDNYSNLYPGQIYDPDDQCRIANGLKSRYKGGGEDLCRVLECTTGQELRAMDGTSCSNGAWCYRGKCVKDSRAPRAPEHCISGDYKLVIPKTKNSTLQKHFRCDDAEKSPDLCSAETFKHYCCASCSGSRIGETGCQDTIEACSQLEPRDCYYGYYASTCCKTCSALVQNPSNINCLYGDRGTNCSKLVPEVCHLSTQYCCQTCALNLSLANASIYPSTTSAHSTTTLPMSAPTTIPLNATVATAELPESTSGTKEIYTTSSLPDTTSLFSTPSMKMVQSFISNKAKFEAEFVSSVSSNPSNLISMTLPPFTNENSTSSSTKASTNSISSNAEVTSSASSDTTSAEFTIKPFSSTDITTTSSQIKESTIYTNSNATVVDLKNGYETIFASSSAQETMSVFSTKMFSSFTNVTSTPSLIADSSEYFGDVLANNSVTVEKIHVISTIKPLSFTDVTTPSPTKAPTISTNSNSAAFENRTDTIFTGLPLQVYLSNSSTASFPKTFTETPSHPTTSNGFVPPKSSTVANTGFKNDFCKDFNGTLSCQLVGAKPLFANCKLLAFHNPIFCNDENFQKYCCASCSGIKVIKKDHCTRDNDSEAPFKNLSKDGTCKSLALNMPWLCQTKDMKKQCCKSCGLFTIKPLKFLQ